MRGTARQTIPLTESSAIGVVVIAQTTAAADKFEQQRLALAASDQVVRLVRVRMEDERPRSYEVVVLPLGLFPGLAAKSVTDDIVMLAARHGLTLGSATEYFDTTHASPEVAEHLGNDPDEAVLKLDRVVRSADGVPVEWRVAFYLDW